MNKAFFLVILMLMLGCILGFMQSDNLRSAGYLSPYALEVTNDGREILIVELTGRRLDVLSVASGKITKSIALPDEPHGVCATRDDKTAYVAMGEGQGYVAVVDLAAGKINAIIKAGHGSYSPVLSLDEKKLYVCNRFDNAVGVIDLVAKRQVLNIPVAREPIAAVITPDGKTLFVANHNPDGPANLDYVASKISVIDTGKNKAINTIKLVNGAEGMRGIAVSPDGKFVYATHLMARFMIPTTQIERGWINTNALSIIRVEDQKLLYTLLLDDVDKGFANPWGVAVSADSKVLCVSSAGNSEVSLIDLPALTAKINVEVSKLGGGGEAMHLNAHNDLSMLVGLRERIELQGEGPRALAFVGNKIYVAQYFSDSFDVLTLKDGQVDDIATIPLGPQLPLTVERKGEIRFNDAKVCFQNWQSCASCHPDARMDALNWDLLNDGIGNPKNAKSMFMSHKTPPVMALGVRDKAETAVRAGIKYIQFVVRPESEAVAIDAYLSKLKQTPSPLLVDGGLSESAKRGEKIFTKSSCITCHPAPLYTDLKQYDVGTGTGQDKGKKFDVPTLREVWRSSPYLHDGRAVTIEEVIKNHNPLDKRGKTSDLSDQEIADLAEYVGSL